MEDLVGSWFAHWPSTRTAWLKWRNLWRRWPRCAAALAVVTLALALLGRVPEVAYIITLAARYPIFAASLTAVLATTLALRCGWRLRSRRHQDWLAALPCDVPPVIRAGIGPFVVVVIGAVLIALVSLAAPLSARIALRLIGAIAAGSSIGVMLAAALTTVNAHPDRRSGTAAQAQMRSRYVPERITRGAAPRRASLLPLGAWVVAEAQFRDRPRIRARSLILLLLAVPMGVSGGVVLTVAAVWLLALHLINLTRALLRTAFSAACWLAPTAPDQLHFTVALTYRALGAQLLSAALLLGIVAITRGESDLRLAGLALGGWFAAVLLLGTVACHIALRARYCAASMFPRWAP